jgi:hypothetical protein
MVPPRKPRDESAKTTIALQDNQIRMLVDRCHELKILLDREIGYREMDKQHHESMQEIFDKTAEDLNAKVLAYTRLQGWQDCAREILQSKSTGE